jgi:hypothetical protein
MPPYRVHIAGFSTLVLEYCTQHPDTNTPVLSCVIFIATHAV